MNTMRIILALLAVIVCAVSASAQNRTVAFVNTADFEHPASGIKRFAGAFAQVDSEFDARRSELQELQRKIQEQSDLVAYAGPIPTDPTPMTPERKKLLRQQAEDLRRSFEQKQQVAERAYNRRMDEVKAVIYGDIRESLMWFAKRRGISVVVEGSKTSCYTGNCREWEKLDVTTEFVDEYNRTHP